jgi:hypothetical protein
MALISSYIIKIDKIFDKKVLIFQQNIGFIEKSFINYVFYK